jgi:uncharacterized membrane protein
MSASTKLATRGAPIGLGLFSVALGMSQIIAPRAIARLVGVRASRRLCVLMRLLGAREIASGIGLLGGRRVAAWLGARFAGDVIDMTLLKAAFRLPGAKRGRVLGALAAVGGVALLDATGHRAAGKADRTHAAAPVRKSITIGRAPSDVYAFWRDLGNVPGFMKHVEAVEVLDDRRSRWRARGPVGGVVEWEAYVIEDRENELLRWESSERSSIATAGAVRFMPAPGGRGTEVHIELSYDPPGGELGRIVSSFWGAGSAHALETDLRRLKQLLETGYIVHSDASVHEGPHAARPSAGPVSTEEVSS